MTITAHWPTCAYRNPDTDALCLGKRAGRYVYCLAHLDPDQLDQVLRHLGPNADVDASGTEIDTTLFDRILRAMDGEGNHPAFGSVCFEHAHFTGNVSFANSRYRGSASFMGTLFSGSATFEGAHFDRQVSFTEACFKGEISFAAAVFGQNTEFCRTDFGRNARFDNVAFGASAIFVDARFSQRANFDGVEFTGGTWFHGAHFDMKPNYLYSDMSSEASFADAHFHGEVGFDGVEFASGASFKNAKFEHTAKLGPLVAASLTFQGASFACPAVIEAAAVKLDCSNTTWKAGVTMSLRYAQVDVKRATFTVPSFITGAAHPFELTPNFRSLDEEEVRRRSYSNHQKAPWMPFFTSLRGTDISHLYFDQVDLSEYRRGIRLIAHLCWTGLKETIKGIGRLLFEIAKGIAKAAAKVSIKPLFWTVVKFAPGAIASLLAWFAAGHRGVYAAVLTVVIIALIATALGRRRIADRLGVPIRAQYVTGSGWSAPYGYTRVTRGNGRLFTILEFATLRSRVMRMEKMTKRRFLDQPAPDQHIRRTEVQRRINAWAHFPANTSPRPPVLLDPPILGAPLLGRTTSSSLHSGFLNSVRRFAAELLEAVQHRKSRITIGPTRKQFTNAEHALTMFFRQCFPAALEKEKQPYSLLEWYRQQDYQLGDPPSVAIVRLYATSFITDRGKRKLEAWQLRASGISEPIWVLDRDINAQFWHPRALADGDRSWAGSAAQLDADGRTIVLRFSAPAQEQIIYPGAEVIETSGAVAVIPMPVNIEPATVKRPKQRYEVTAVLAQPLGQRVLLDGNGSLVLVCRSREHRRQTP